MDNHLTTLILLYEEEKNKLEKFISACLAEGEYLQAHYYSKELHQINHRLETLKNINDNHVAPPETTDTNGISLFDTILNPLLDRQVKNVKLILKKSENIFFAFTYSNKTLKVTLPHVKQLMKKWILHDGDIKAFKNLGFILTEKESKLVLTITGSKQEIIYKAALILSKIVFEIFSFRQFKNESYLQFTDK